MQGCERARQAVIEPTNPATEQIHLDSERVTACLKRFALDFLQSSVLPDQQRNPKYHIKWHKAHSPGGWDWSFTGYQRSLINSFLLLNLGDSKVAFHIWTVGLPKIAGESVQGVTDVCLLQSCMHECLHWFASLAKDLVQHTAHPDYQIQLALSFLTPSADQNLRKEKLQQARQEVTSADPMRRTPLLQSLTCACGLDLTACGACDKGWAQVGMSDERADPSKGTIAPAQAIVHQ